MRGFTAIAYALQTVALVTYVITVSNVYWGLAVLHTAAILFHITDDVCAAIRARGQT